MEIPLDPILQKYIENLRNSGRESEIDLLLFNSQIMKHIEDKVKFGIKLQELIEELTPIIKQFIDKELAEKTVESVLGVKHYNAVSIICNHVINWYIKILESLGKLRIRESRS